MTSVKQFKQENNGLIYIKTRNTYEPHKHTTTSEQQAPDLKQVPTNATGLNISKSANLHPNLKQ